MTTAYMNDFISALVFWSIVTAMRAGMMELGLGKRSTCYKNSEMRSECERRHENDL